MLQVIERRKISDVVVDRLKEYITGMGLRTGDRLPTEHALAKQFGASRITVREATKALGFLGILDAKPGRGLTVGRVDVGRMTECLRFHPAWHEDQAEQLIDTRVILETGVVPFVIRRMAADPTVYERLKDINAELQNTRDLARFIELDIAFHRLLVESSGLAPLVAFNELLQVFFQRFRESVKKAEWKTGIEGHQRIIDALRAGKTTAAVNLLRKHVESHRGRL